MKIPINNDVLIATMQSMVQKFSNNPEKVKNIKIKQQTIDGECQLSMDVSFVAEDEMDACFETGKSIEINFNM